MTAAELREARRTIERAFHQADRLCLHYRGSYELHKAKELAIADERQHRALGKRMVGDIGKRLPFETVGMLFALKGFLTPQSKRHYSHRRDLVQGYSAAHGACFTAEGLAAYKAFCSEWRRTIQRLDYAELQA